MPPKSELGTSLTNLPPPQKRWTLPSTSLPRGKWLSSLRAPRGKRLKIPGKASDKRPKSRAEAVETARKSALEQQASVARENERIAKRLEEAHRPQDFAAIRDDAGLVHDQSVMARKAVQEWVAQTEQWHEKINEAVPQLEEAVGVAQEEGRACWGLC